MQFILDSLAKSLFLLLLFFAGGIGPGKTNKEQSGGKHLGWGVEGEGEPDWRDLSISD